MMKRIHSDEVTPALRSVFRTDEPQACRCFAVLDGTQPRGAILCDDSTNPTWAVVMEPSDNSLFFGGKLSASTVATVFHALRHAGDLLVGMWLDDPRQALLPPNPAYDGRTLEFYDRPLHAALEQYLAVPDGCQIHHINRDLVMQTEWGPGDVAAWGSLEAWEQNSEAIA